MEKLMHKSGVDVLVKTTMYEDACEAELNQAKSLVSDYISKIINEDDKSTIIEVRNLPVLCELSNVDMFVADQLRPFGKLMFAKEIPLEEATTLLYKLNTMLECSYSFDDLYKNNKTYLKEDGSYSIKFDNINIGLIDSYKTKLTQRATYCNECLFNDLYSADILTESLPALIYCYESNEN